MAKSSENKLEAAITSLRAERAELLGRVSEIDASFARLGIEVGAVAGGVVAKRRGRPPKALAAPKAGKKAKASRFGVSGEAAILEFVTKAGQPNSAEVNKAWSKQGRKGKADNALTKLVKEGKLVRVSVEGERGGRYKLA